MKRNLLCDHSFSPPVRQYILRALSYDRRTGKCRAARDCSCAVVPNRSFIKRMFYSGCDGLNQRIDFTASSLLRREVVLSRVSALLRLARDSKHSMCAERAACIELWCPTLCVCVSHAVCLSDTLSQKHGALCAMPMEKAKPRVDGAWSVRTNM